GWAFVPPHYSFGLPTQGQVIEYVLFLFATMLAVWLAGTYRHAVLRRYRDSSAILEFIAPMIVSFGVVLITTLIVLSIEPRLGTQYLVFSYLIPTTLMALLYGGTSAVVTAFASGLAAAYFLFAPRFSLYVVDPVHVAEL